MTDSRLQDVIMIDDEQSILQITTESKPDQADPIVNNNNEICRSLNL